MRNAQRHSAETIAALRGIGGRYAKADAPCVVPKWVPRDLFHDYVQNAVLYGEEKAASIVRALKSEAERAS